MDKKTYYIRIVLIVVCFAIGSACFYQMNQSYDPLARYPYVSDENREIILEYLDADDIDYLITQQIKPKVFMNFIDVYGFDIHNALFYDVAKKNQDATNDYIVNFVNKYRSNFSKDTLALLLKNYSYVDLTTFFENESIFNSELELVSNPSYPYVVLNSNRTVYKYIPDNLKKVGNIEVKQEIINDLNSMSSDFSKVMPKGEKLTFTQGYLSYEKLLEQNMNTQVEKEAYFYYQFDAGQSEYQLGYTVALPEHQEWVEYCIKEEIYKSKDYKKALENLSDADKLKVEWLEDNAYRYGFVIRYPKEKEAETKQAYQPFVLRYVGKKTAKKMHESNLVMEEMKFDSELN